VRVLIDQIEESLVGISLSEKDKGTIIELHASQNTNLW
jgi:hypothetical protein